MPRFSRRQFLQSSLAAAATVTIAGTKSSGKVLGSNDTIRVAVAGINGRGGAHVGEFAGMQGVEVVYLVDPDTRTYPGKIKQVEGKGGKTPKTEQDIRKVLQDKTVDAISIATPNHWHSLMTIWACQAGKHVYVEKPCSHNVHEGRIAVEAARKYNRIVQHGTQSRSDGKKSEVMAVIHSGKLGKLLVSRGLCYKSRKSIGSHAATPAPSEIDFNLWLGPAAEQPHHKNLVHYNWHWFWDFGNGDIGNQGVHEMDLARWAIAGATLPANVVCMGGRFGYKDQGQTPNTQVAVMDYGPTQLIFEVRGLPTDKLMGQTVGNIYHLEEGVIVGTKFYPKGSDKEAPLPKVEVKRGPGGGNFGNFIAAVRSGKVSDLNADILEGHYSSALCHLANISYRMGQDVPFANAVKEFNGHKDGAEAVERVQKHLTDNEVKIDGLMCRMGKKLSIKPEAERFSGDEKANALLTREYRKGFAVPEKLG